MNMKASKLTISVLLLLTSSLSACGSSSSLEEVIAEIDTDTTELDPTLDPMDFTGAWRTSCIPVNESSVRTVFLELLANGDYQMESSTFDGQDCSSIENQRFLQTESGTFTVSEQVDVPSGVAAFGVTFEAEARETNGEPVSISGDELFLDLIHRDGNMLIRALGNPVGTAGVQFSEELDFSIVYFLE